jgi:formylmethanofuran dehydrogenase subunit E
MDYIPDYTELHKAFEDEQEAAESRLPKCDNCGETILDDYLFDIDGTIYCAECLNEMFRKSADDYID